MNCQEFPRNITIIEVLSLSIEERTKLGEKAQQFILDTKNATIQCTKILELIKRT